MASALIGYTGFVGGNLLRQRRFDELYNSRNIERIAGRRFDLVVCAGAPAEKWKANQDPAADWRSLQRLIDALSEVETERLVLISTVDVFGKPIGVTEEDTPADATHYGRHRSRLEQILSDWFRTLVVRLPGLFGPGLRKNAIYDLIHDNQVERIDSRAVYQFYPMQFLWRDVQTALNAGLPLIHFATGPVSIREVAQAAFGRDFQNEVAPLPAVYDMRTQFDALYGGAQGYLYSREQCLSLIGEFVSSGKEMRKCA